MKITAINGSPKTAGISALIIKQMEKLLDEQIVKHHAIRLVHAETPNETIEGMLETDILLIVFPLYIDSLPSPLIEILTRLENTMQRSAAIPQIFAIVNGALDATQTTLSLEMIEHFTCRAGLVWGYGIGIGEGSMLHNAGDNWEKGLASDIYHALCDMAMDIKKKRSRLNVYVTPKISPFLYKTIANTGFRLEAKRNKTGNLRARPYINL